MSSAALSPMMEQYRRIKRDHQGEVLFFRLGDFYEMFFEDAINISSLLNLTLTNRQGYPMCGIPYHASHTYIARLLKEGKKVAICEQVTGAGQGSKTGLMERRVVEIITPGTTVDEDYLDRGSPNYLACLACTTGKHGGGCFSFSYVDLSIGEFYATSFTAHLNALRVRQELERLQPREIIVQESILNEYPELAAALEERSGLVVNRWADWLFDAARSRDRLERQFSSLKAFGLNPSSPEIVSSGALLDYLDTTSKSLLPHIRFIKIYGDSEFVSLDESTQRNLELVKNLMDGEGRFTLLEVMDETKTAMGRRLLRTRILHPLRNEAQIKRRLDMVESLYRNQDKLGQTRELLSKTPDLERLSSRLAMDRAHGKDIAAIQKTLCFFRQIEEILGDLSNGFESPEAQSLNQKGQEHLAVLEEYLEKGIAEDPSILLTEGNLIRGGFNAELDRLKELRDSGRKLLEEYLEEEREATGITGLKIRYNRLIGYFFEVSNVNLSRVPAHFIRRQGLAGSERYTTDRLINMESEINSASDKIIELEKKLFLEIRDKAKTRLPELSAAAKRVAELDTAASLARAATIHGWARPLVDGENRTIISEGRHPVVEAHLKRGEFIPNDLALNATGSTSGNATGNTSDTGVFFALITGPNMAGKSTYLRQAALITLMAQTGSFVPASEACIGLVDRIYCRVGASDNLARGESTFLVEMNETSYILNTATERSLVIMDEVGRGTGTKDGLAIAWAVCEELLEKLKCRTLFATHYHELSNIVHPGMANRSMEVAERDGGIIFLRKLKEGPAAESYGLHVAALAGLSESVLGRAREIMTTLSDNRAALQELPPRVDNEIPTGNKPAPTQNENAIMLKELSEINIDNITPLEALNLIQRWKNIRSDSGKKSPLEVKEPEPTLFD